MDFLFSSLHPNTSFLLPLSLHFTYHPTPPPLPSSILLLLSKPTPPPPPSLHPSVLSSLCVSLSKDSVKQTESRGEMFTLQEYAGLWPLQWGWARAEALRLLEHTHTHRPSSISISSYYPCFFYVRVISIHWLPGFYYINNNLCSNGV